MVRTADFLIREVRREDGGFLSQLLYEAATWGRGPITHCLKKSFLDPRSPCTSTGGAPGDQGLIAENGTDEPVGAALKPGRSRALISK